MESRDQLVSITEAPTDVPLGIRRARAAFLRDFDDLLADSNTRGKYVCYHNDARVAVTADYVAMMRELVGRNIPEDASLVFKVTSSADIAERAIADEAETDPS